MVPILDPACACACSAQSKLIGVQALFLYPLNAPNPESAKAPERLDVILRRRATVLPLQRTDPKKQPQGLRDQLQKWGARS